MRMNRIVLWSLLAGAPVVALPAIASAAMPPGPDVQKALESAKVTLAQAITTVEKQTGGKSTHAMFGEEAGKSGYTVIAYSGAKMQAMWVDPLSGAASVIAKPTPDETSIETADKAEEPTLIGAKATLSQAVALAERHDGGRAFDAALARHNNMVAISVDVLKDGKLSTVWIDPAAGKIES